MFEEKIKHIGFVVYIYFIILHHNNALSRIRMKSRLIISVLVISLSLVSCGSIKKSTRNRIHRDVDSFHQKAEKRWSRMSFIDGEGDSWRAIECIA